MRRDRATPRRHRGLGARLAAPDRGHGHRRTAPELGAADLWRQQDEADGPVTLTVQQYQAPETLVVATDGGPLETLTVTVTDKSWFVEAVIAALVGLFLFFAGLILLFSRPQAPRPAGGTPRPPPHPVTDADATTPPPTPDHEEVTR